MDPTTVFIPEVLDIKPSGSIPKNILVAPQLGSHWDRLLRELPDGYEFKVCTEPPTLRHVLNCYDHLEQYGWGNYVLLNPGITGDVLLNIDIENKYANENIWEAIKNSRDLLQDLNEDEFHYLCENPAAFRYAITQLKKKDICGAIRLFHNPKAEGCIISRYFDAKKMLQSGAEYEYLYPYFDKEFIKKILKGKSHNDIFVSLAQNPAAKDLIEEYFPYITKHRREWLYCLCGMKHLINLVRANIHLFTDEESHFRINTDELMVDFLTDNPKFIRWNYLAYNGAAMPLLEKYITESKEPLDEEFLNRLNKNPSAIPFLMRHQHLINSEILENPAIFV